VPAAFLRGFIVEVSPPAAQDPGRMCTVLEKS